MVNWPHIIGLWLFGALICGAVATNLGSTALAAFAIPLAVALSVVYVSSYVNSTLLSLLPYVLFFLTATTNLFGETEALTGMPSASKNDWLFGIAFYTTSLAYLLKSRSTLSLIDTLKVTNPLILISGPIALYMRSDLHKKIGVRANYYFPFILVGFFFLNVVAAPLALTLPLAESTDLLSVAISTVIFELFVYFNFAGISLTVYGLFGILGIKIPLNFRQPFSSRNVIEFWRGWHISLSLVLRTLFYNPTRRFYGRTLSIFAVFMSSALWHGATLNFLLWGALHTISFLLTLFFIRYHMKYLNLFLLAVSIFLGRLIFAESDTQVLLQKLSFTYKNQNAFAVLVDFPATTLVSLFFAILLVSLEFFGKDIKIIGKRNYKFLRTPISLLLISVITLLLIKENGLLYAVYAQR